ncbi:hypothetical protein CRG98_034535 [Punica granatum]|uniref:Uncharacterized protein n=1 Tax=Punica granatum TaxID=22663 RepID=A0A2I0IMZ2_PUNGR|nr:hypothetical protein CRG98_034535 [Punica granatum]
MADDFPYKRSRRPFMPKATFPPACGKLGRDLPWPAASLPGKGGLVQGASVLASLEARTGSKLCAHDK